MSLGVVCRIAWVALLALACAREPETGREVASSGALEPTWPQFRGPFGSGVADDAPLPARWNVETGEGVLWRAPIEGFAHSSPVIAGDRVFLTTAVRSGGSERFDLERRGDNRTLVEDAEYALSLLAVDRESGEILWRRECFVGRPAVHRHPRNSHASATPATDGRVVVAFFASEGLHAFDVDGRPLWTRDFGVIDQGAFESPETQYGGGASPVIHAGRVILQCDAQRNSFLTALDAGTGETIWRVPRGDVPTWSTPTIQVVGGETRVLCNGYREMAAYAFSDGTRRFRMSGGGDTPVPTPVCFEDLAIFTSSHGRNSPIYAVGPEASGHLRPLEGDAPGLRWMRRQRGSYIPTPIAYRGLLYVLNDAGVLSCYDAATGEDVYRARPGVGRSYYSASPVAGDGKLYLMSDAGDARVIRAGREFEVLATNPMGEAVMATPAIADGVLYVRTIEHLVAISGVGPVAGD